MIKYSANAHDTHDSISLISYVDYFALTFVYFKMKIHYKCPSQYKISKNTSKVYFGFQGRSRLCMLVLPEDASTVYKSPKQAYIIRTIYGNDNGVIYLFSFFAHNKFNIAHITVLKCSSLCKPNSN